MPSSTNLSRPAVRLHSRAILIGTAFVTRACHTRAAAGAASLTVTHVTP
ncbi:hypothetical protein ARTHRO8AJ_390126 [Arthrobacter sp. 8AJ]|nr:hypothetical protein ARTHRO8AJ_390126 [Arthrobacter sp. 8AJ]